MEDRSKLPPFSSVEKRGRDPLTGSNRRKFQIKIKTPKKRAVHLKTGTG